VIEEIFPPTVATAEALNDAGRPAVPRGRTRSRPGGADTATRVRHPVASAPPGAGQSGRTARSATARGEGRTDVADRRGRQHHAVRRYRAAAVAWTSDILGRNAEPNDAFPDGLIDMIAVPEEFAGLGRYSSGVHRHRLLFSAKECVYQAWYPLIGTWLVFDEVAVTFDGDDATFTARLPGGSPMVGGPPLGPLSDRWQMCGRLVVTAIALPARPS
jgi:hypothetical protein